MFVKSKYLPIINPNVNPSIRYIFIGILNSKIDNKYKYSRYRSKKLRDEMRYRSKKHVLEIIKHAL
jgi:hypothetical protein